MRRIPKRVGRFERRGEERSGVGGRGGSQRRGRVVIRKGEGKFRERRRESLGEERV